MVVDVKGLLERSEGKGELNLADAGSTAKASAEVKRLQALARRLDAVCIDLSKAISSKNMDALADAEDSLLDVMEDMTIAWKQAESIISDAVG